MPDNWCLFSGSSVKKLSLEIANFLGKPLGKIQINRFPDGEIGVRILEDVKGKDAIVVQAMAKDPNSYLMELLIIIDALKRAAVRRVICVIPYFGYARQDYIVEKGEPITAKLVANMLQAVQVDHVLTLDLHSRQIQGFFDIPLENLSSRKVLLNAIKKENLKNLIVVAPDVGRSKEARKLAEELMAEYAIIDKHRISEKKVMFCALIGDVKGKNAVIIDDICSTGQTMLSAISVLKKEGAKEIFAAISHYLQEEDTLFKGKVKKIWTLDTIERVKNPPLLQVVSCAQEFAISLKNIL